MGTGRLGAADEEEEEDREGEGTGDAAEMANEVGVLLLSASLLLRRKLSDPGLWGADLTCPSLLRATGRSMGTQAGKGEVTVEGEDFHTKKTRCWKRNNFKKEKNKEKKWFFFYLFLLQQQQQ